MIKPRPNHDPQSPQSSSEGGSGGQTVQSGSLRKRERLWEEERGERERGVSCPNAGERERVAGRNYYKGPHETRRTLSRSGNYYYYYYYQHSLLPSSIHKKTCQHVENQWAFYGLPPGAVCVTTYKWVLREVSPLHFQISCAVARMERGHGWQRRGRCWRNKEGFRGAGKLPLVGWLYWIYGWSVVKFWIWVN